MAAAFRLGAAIALLILGPTCAWVRAQCRDKSFGTLEKQGYTVGTVRLTGAFLASGGLERWMPLVKGRDGMTALISKVLSPSSSNT